MEMKLEHLRKEYLSTSLNRDDLREDPYDQFQHWFQQARAADLIEPNAMSLATVDRDGSPSIRTVLLKTVDHEGFVFFTNKQSQKALDIASNPCVALLFPWLALERQVKVIGKSEAVPKEQSNYSRWYAPDNRTTHEVLGNLTALEDIALRGRPRQ